VGQALVALRRGVYPKGYARNPAKTWECAVFPEKVPMRGTEMGTTLRVRAHEAENPRG